VIGPASRDLNGLGHPRPVAAPAERDSAPTFVELVGWLGSHDAAVTFLRSVAPSHDASDLLTGSPRRYPHHPPPDPNCFERAALYLAIAELIDPTPPRKVP
jgi:hypothetical protein